MSERAVGVWAGTSEPERRRLRVERGEIVASKPSAAQSRRPCPA